MIHWDTGHQGGEFTQWLFFNLDPGRFFPVAAKRNRSEQEERRADHADDRKRYERLLASKKPDIDTLYVLLIRAQVHQADPAVVVAPSIVLLLLPHLLLRQHVGLVLCAALVQTDQLFAPFRLLPDERPRRTSSLPMKWAKQASPGQISHNAALRKRYAEPKGEGMSTEDVERADTLIARDARKRLKKARGSRRLKLRRGRRSYWQRGHKRQKVAEDNLKGGQEKGSGSAYC